MKSSSPSTRRSEMKRPEPTAPPAVDKAGGGGGGGGPVDEEHERWQKMSRAARAKYIAGNVTVEPLLGLFIVSSVLGGLATQNLNLQKSCRVNLQMGDAVCSALERRNRSSYSTEDEARVQRLVANMSVWQSLIQHSVPCIFVIFVGSWSDRTGRRKPILLLPIFGELVRVLGLLVCVYYFYELPMEVAGVVESLPSSLTGGWMIMFMAVFTYISDVTTVKMRTLRIGVLNLSLTIGISMGIALSGILFQELGFYGIYSISVTMYLMGIIYGFIYIKDPKINNAEPMAIENSKKSSLRTSIKNFFDIKHLKNAFGVTFKKGTNNRRFRILTMMLVLMIIMGPMSGEMSVMYLSTRIRFNWNELDYSMFSTFTMVTGFVGTSISLWGFNHKLKMDDTLIAAIACTSKVVGSFVFAFAPNPYIFYMGSVVEIMCGAGNIATRSIFTKLVEPDELGQVSAVVGVFEAFVPMIYTPMYSSFYQATMETFPGAYYLLGGGLTIPAIFIFLWMYKNKKKQAAADQIVEKSSAIQENNDLNINNKIVLKIHETSEKNGFSNLAYQADVCEKD